MDKYKFWIIFTAILMSGLIILSLIIGMSWVNSPTTFIIEIGLDKESLEVINSSLELKVPLEDAVELAEKYEGLINEIS